MPITRYVNMCLLGFVIALLSGTDAWSEAPNSPNAKTSMFHAHNVPSGSLRVGEVMHVATRAELKAAGWGYDVLIAAGIKDVDIRDGSAVAARVFCCGGSNEFPTGLLAYVPPSLKVDIGDIIEVWSGKMVSQSDPLGAVPNTVTRVVEKANSSPKHCSWLPDKPGLWMRVIYCDWMPAAGWRQQQSELFPLWVNPINAATPPAAKP